MPVQTGSCHCAAVRFAYVPSPGPTFHCNCSLCHRRGAVWQGCAAAQFGLLAGQEDLLTYTFGTHTAQHFFCRHCGVAPFSHPRLSPRHWVINLRCVDGVDLSARVVHLFDGQHWEEAAEAFLQSRAPAPADGAE
ncbi:GFA family protein [Bacillus subtilis subsp. subtilis]|nr:GFA family protein [Bacillus subtilis subsp. subtilis]